RNLTKHIDGAALLQTAAPAALVRLPALMYNKIPTALQHCSKQYHSIMKSNTCSTTPSSTVPQHCCSNVQQLSRTHTPAQLVCSKSSQVKSKSQAKASLSPLHTCC
ncbi:unnamed protein product, partial [Chrysoparadoxa australica]